MRSSSSGSMETRVTAQPCASSPGRGRGVALALLLLLVGACGAPSAGEAGGDEPAGESEGDSEEGREDTEQEGPRAAAGAGTLAAAAHEVPQQTPEQASCVAALEDSTPTALRDLLSDLGYREALADACASQRAVREGDPAACDALTATALRAGCRRRLAVRHGRPDDCPPWLDRGRDPTCLAWAARAPARCAAVPGTDALVCRAPFERNPELCRELGVEQLACEAAVARVGPLLEPRDPRALPPVDGRLVGHFIADGPRAATPSTELRVELDLTHGLYVERHEGVATLQLAPARRTLAHHEKLQLSPFLVRLGPLEDEPLRDVALGPDVLRVGLLPLVGGPPVRASTDAPTRGRETLEVPVDPGPSGRVGVVRLGPRRGGEVVLDVDVRVPAAGGAYRLTGVLRTFVRDIDPL
ncbi:MAG: hypothetical protein H6726_09955 [Sandaracinaceae bacterium]|nr:hypothetical protein [Myxococcales bacterium]MCB9657959.1 hypothetical protein [Sandaracinaceae bacterium]